MYFGTFNAFEVDPGLFLNREAECEWLSQSVLAWLARSTDKEARQSWCVHGPKGSGKTIFARKVLRDIQSQAPQHLTNTLFIEADCRRLNSSRAVYNAVATEIVMALGRLIDARVRVPEELMGLGQAILALTRLEGNVEAQVAREHLVRFEASFLGKLSSTIRLVLERTFGLKVEGSRKDTQTLKGTLRFDDAGLCNLLKAYFATLREAGLRTLLFVDNVDELQHEFDTADVRTRVRAQTELVLDLADAPIGMLVCMRSYFSSVARSIPKRKLAPLDGPHLLKILDKRVAREAKEVAALAQRPEVRAMAQWLSERAPTPLAYLQWFQNLAEREAWEGEARRRAVREVIESEYANVPYDVIQKVVSLYERVDGEVGRERVASACDANDFAVLQDRQVILPNDFWSPSRFTLDPLLHILHPSRF